MVGDHAIGNIDRVFECLFISAWLISTRTGDLLDLGENRLEHIRVIVAINTLQDADDAFKAHAGVDVLGGQRDQLPGLLAVVLDKNEVPYFDNGVLSIRVDKRRAIFIGAAVVVEFRAWAARAGVAHLPEVVLLVAGMDARRGEVLEPEFFRFEVGLKAFVCVAFEIGRVQAFGVDAPYVDQELPRPVDGLLFEVVAKGPVAEHLEEGVVVGVLAHIVEVVVLAASADAFLRIHRAGEGRLFGAEEVRLELVHSRVGEEQRRVVVRDNRRGRDLRVLGLVDKEVDELAANLRAGRFWGCGHSLVWRMGFAGVWNAAVYPPERL